MGTQKLWIKVIVWRLISIALTLLTTYFYTGNISEASGLTMVLHAVLIVGHYLFERFWDGKNTVQAPE